MFLASLVVCGLAVRPSLTLGQNGEIAQVVLKLPGTRQPPEWAPKRVPQLTVNGREVKFTPAKWDTDEELTVKLDTKDAGKKIKIVYSFWPYTYSNTIRTKEVTADAGKKGVVVDFHKEDPGRPDLIKPIYFPTPPQVVEAMCKMGQVGKDDVVFDIGCGDGRMVITGVKKFGAKKGVGIDIDADLVKKCRANAKEAGVSDKTEFRNENALEMKDLSEATVVLLYVGEDFGAALEPVLRKTLKPGARIVSHRFPLGKWEPDTEKTITAKNNYDMDEEYVLKLWKIK
jgi:SAM-dependent methyltransferase